MRVSSNRPGSVRSRVYDRDGNHCRYCGLEVEQRDNNRRGLSFRHDTRIPRLRTMDHVVPRSRGGLTSVENCVTACGVCNHLKADRTPQEAGMLLLPEPDLVALSWGDPAWAWPTMEVA